MSFHRWNPMLHSVESSYWFDERTFGAEICKGLEFDPEKGDVVISSILIRGGCLKPYLIAFPADHGLISFKSIDLNWLLRQRNVTNIAFAGFNFCCKRLH